MESTLVPHPPPPMATGWEVGAKEGGIERRGGTGREGEKCVTRVFSTSRQSGVGTRAASSRADKSHAWRFKLVFKSVGERRDLGLELGELVATGWEVGAKEGGIRRGAQGGRGKWGDA